MASAKEAMFTHDRFDLILLDLSMPGTKGFEGLLELRTMFPRQPIVIVSALEDPRIVHEAMTYGASGYISKSVRKAELAQAIRDAMAGIVTLPKGYEMQKPAGKSSNSGDLAQRLGSLTRQQLRVLQMLRQGKLNKQIAHELDVGETTVKAHVSEISAEAQCGLADASRDRGFQDRLRRRVAQEPLLDDHRRRELR